MKIKIITVGKLKEKYWTQAVSEYSKRLSRYCKFELIEVKDEHIPEKFSVAEQEKAVFQEGQRILKHIDRDAEIITMEINGQSMTSEKFAGYIDQCGITGKNNLVFIIGGSLGLSPEITQRANKHLSFSPMTFPHQMFRVMLLEQIYRAFKIINNETYHK